MNRARYRPRLETLEDRTTPAVNVFLSSTTLSIVGDNAKQGSYVSLSLVNDPDTGDVLFQVDTGLNNYGSINSEFYPLRSNVSIRTGRNNDRVIVNGGPLDTPADTNLRINIDLGGGDDGVALRMNGLTITGNSRVSVSVNGGLGNDTIGADLAGTVDEGSTLNLAFDGSFGKDSIRVGNNFGRLNLSGTLNIQAYGQSNRDTATVDLVFQPVQDKFLQGTFNGYIRGGLSADQLRLTVANIAADSGNVRYNGRIDAGPLDTVVASSGTVVKYARAKKTVFVAITNELPELLSI